MNNDRATVGLECKWWVTIARSAAGFVTDADVCLYIFANSGQIRGDWSSVLANYRLWNCRCATITLKRLYENW